MILSNYRLQRLVGRRGHFDEDRFAFGVALVHAVQHQAVKVNVEIGRRAKSLDQRDRAAVGIVSLQTRLPKQEARDDAVHHLQHQLGLCSQQQAKRDRQCQHPLAHRHVRNDVIDQVGRRMRHAPGSARRAKPRRLQLKATSLSCPKSPQRSRRKPWTRMPHSRKASNSSFTNCGRLAPAAASA